MNHKKKFDKKIFDDVYSVDNGTFWYEKHKEEARKEKKRLKLHQSITNLQKEIEETTKKQLYVDNKTERIKSEIDEIKKRIDYLSSELIESRKTFSRKIAKELSKYDWYYPEVNRGSASLDAAWSYFEKITLPRQYCDENAAKRDGLEKAPPGEYERETVSSSENFIFLAFVTTYSFELTLEIVQHLSHSE